MAEDGAGRPSTPPATAVRETNPLTPEQVRKIEINRLKAKAVREQREAAARAEEISGRGSANASGTSPSNIVAGQKRAFGAISSQKAPSTSRDARDTEAARPAGFRPLDEIQPARNFAKYVEYDFSKMTDTKGGFLTTEDDPHNKALRAAGEEESKPAHMTQKEWERHQLLKSLRERRAGPFEPGLSAVKSRETKSCRECDNVEIDFKWDEIFGCAVCNACKEKFPEKYSLLTKTEAREDYLLTDPELRDEQLLPHLERPNPHKSTWNNMMLFLRYQVEEYAFGQKWGSADALDSAFEKREAEKKRRKQDKFKSKLQELKKRTRVDAYKRNKQSGAGGGGNFGDTVNRDAKHIHTWGRVVEDESTGIGVKTCVECDMQVEELEF